MPDFNTLLYASALVAIPLLLMLFVAAILNRKVPGAPLLASGLMLFVASFVLHGLARGPYLTISANTITVAGLFMVLMAYKRFNERQCPGRGWFFAVPLAALVLQTLFLGSTYWHLLDLALLAIYAGLSLWIVRELLHPISRLKAANIIVAVMYITLTIAYLYGMTVLPFAGYAAMFNLYGMHVDFLALIFLPMMGFSYFISLNDYMGKHLARLADTDYLTGLPGRRAFNEQAERILQRATINKVPVSLLVVNIDDFKKLNHEYGYSAGDKVLVHYTRNMLEFFRIGDVICRMGWDEFMVLLPGTDMQQAMQIGERLRDLFDATLVDIGGRQVSATVSIGGSSAMGQNLIVDTLCGQAYNALHRAKQEGKHCVYIESCEVDQSKVEP